MNKRQRRGHGRPTLHDVATAAGVTRITVSRYLRQPDLLAPETAERVRDAIASTGYVPNQQAGQLASGRSRIVAALVPNLGYSVFAETIQGLSDGLADSGYELMLMPTGYSLQREAQQLQALLGWSPSGLVVTGRRHSAEAMAHLRAAKAAGVPVVEMWDRPDAPGSMEEFAAIGFDHRAIGARMAGHLLACGHRRLAYIDSAVVHDYRARERQQGFLEAARAESATVQALAAPEGDPFEAGSRAMGRLWEGTNRPSAVAFANDLLAGGALQWMQGQGLAVPEQLSVLGFGDFPLSRQLRPRLCTVHTPNGEIGRLTAQAILSALKDERAPLSQTLACELLQRESTGAVPS